MRTHVTRQNNEAASAPARAGLSGRSFPIQAKLKTASPEEDATVLKHHAEEPSRSGASFGEVPLFPEQRSARNENGSPLPESLQRKMGAAFQADFSDVRVHQGPDAASLSALAFTQGRDIHFAPGRYNPSSLEGQKIIAHELAHVIQQRQGRVAVPQGRSVPLNADPILEAEADTLGAKAVAGQSVAATGAGSGAKSIISPAGSAPIQGLMDRIREL
jgi:uncharacterized protein DUF4157